MNSQQEQREWQQQIASDSAVSSHNLDVTQLFDPRSMPKDRRENWCKQYLIDRERGRTDLLWLCNNVLNYPDVQPEPHGPVIAHLQQFRGREEYMDPETFSVVYSEPRCSIHDAGADDGVCPPLCFGRSLWTLPGARFRMLLDPRGHLKTTVNTIAHSLQWILNYPNIRILLSVASFDPQGIQIIDEIESHFRFNETFRFLYPEWCPAAESAGSWGSQKSFTVPNRKVHRKEPTMSIASVGKVVAGPHYEVIKCSDLVDEQNVKTDGGLREVKSHFRYMMPLLERGPKIEGRDLTRGWLDLEGTIYHHSDLHVTELEKDEQRIKEQRSCRWSVIRRDAIVNEVLHLTLWPLRFPWEELMAIQEDMDEYTFNCQYRLNPHSRSTGLADRLVYFPGQMRKELLARYRMVKCTVDLAGMEEDSDGCNTVLVTCGHDRDARKDVLDAVIGRINPFQVIDHFFRIDLEYSTGMRKVIFQVEKAHHMQVLKPFLEREMQKRGRQLTVICVPRDSSVSKVNRIWGLQSWFKRALFRFADDLDMTSLRFPLQKLLGNAHIEKEIRNFPNYKFKDFLDALSDQLVTKEGDTDYQAALPDAPKFDDQDLLKAMKVKSMFVGFDPMSKQPVWDYSEDTELVFGMQGLTNKDSRIMERIYGSGVMN